MFGAVCDRRKPGQQQSVVDVSCTRSIANILGIFDRNSSAAAIYDL